MSRTKTFRILLIALITFFNVSCNQKVTENMDAETKGKLFIIGGGHKSNSLIEKMLEVSNLQPDDYAVVLPMASSEPDTAAFYGIEMFRNVNFTNVYAIQYDSINGYSNSDINRLKGAKIIYMTGGDQNKLMKSFESTNIVEIIRTAYKNGATIAGTSAGAAVMSKKMLTGNQRKYPVYTGKYPTIESSNIEIAEGLGLLPQAIVDQHFVKRQRMNRLIAVCLENPVEYAIGIDESTALIVRGNMGEVAGESQIIILKHKNAETKVVNGLLGGQDISLSVYLPGDEFLIYE